MILMTQVFSISVGKMSNRGDQQDAPVDRERFVAFFPQVVKDLVDDELHRPEVADAFDRLKMVRNSECRKGPLKTSIGVDIRHGIFSLNIWESI